MQSATELALREVGDALYEIMLRQPGPARPSLVLRALPEGIGVGPAAARDVLDSDPRFVAAEGRVDLRARSELAGKSFTGAVERLITELGRPLDIAAIAGFFAASSEHDAPYYEQLIAQLLQREKTFLAADGKLVPKSWMLVPEGDNEDDVLFYCDLDADPELAQFRPLCADESLRGASPLETAVSVAVAAAAPLRNKLLGFFVYRLHPTEFDPAALLSAMLKDERLYPTPGLLWVSGEVRLEIRRALADLDRSAAEKAPAEAADLAPILGEPLPADDPGYFIEDDDLQMIYALVNASTTAVSVGEVLAEVLELSPDHPAFIPAAHSVHDLLSNDPTIIALSITTFLGPGGVPSWVREVPAGLIPASGKPGEDVILMEEGLRPGLADKVHDPFLEDIGDDDVTVDAHSYTSDETFIMVSYRHLRAGTLKLRKMDSRFFGIDAPIAPITALDADGQEFLLWVNTETGLILGLKRLYEKLALGPGSLIAITPADAPRRFLFSAAGEDDSGAIAPARLQELEAIAARPDTANKSLFELTRELMSGAPEDVRFERLLSELNVIRRTTRLQLASELSYYQCFRPKDGQGDNWSFAPEAVAAGAVTTKEKYVVQ